MYKTEISKRLNKADYTRLPRLLELQGTFDDITSIEDSKKMLQIADINGSKYMEIYNLKEDVDISNIIQELNAISYHPNLPYIEGQGALTITKVYFHQSDFEILADFYTFDEVWIKSDDGRNQTLTPLHQRRVLHIKYNHNRQKIILTIDPIGDGVKISEDILRYIPEIFNQYNIMFFEYFELATIDNAIYTMIDNEVLRPTRLKSTDEGSNRVYDTLAQNPNDSLTDEVTFTDTRQNTLNINRMRLKHDELNISVELFSDDLLKVWSRANMEQNDGLKENIIQLL